MYVPMPYIIIIKHPTRTQTKSFFAIAITMLRGEPKIYPLDPPQDTQRPGGATRKPPPRIAMKVVKQKLCID